MVAAGELCCLSDNSGYISINARTFLYADKPSNSTTPRRVALARMFKEAGLRSPRTQLTKVKMEISVQGRRTEATPHHVVFSVNLS